VKPKLEYDFVIKDHEERGVPVPPWYIGILQVKMASDETFKRKHSLVLATKNGHPDNHMLEKLKELWRKASLSAFGP
jgi:hypothetical protein